METFSIKGCNVEYIDDSHTYLVNGVILPSITQLLKLKFSNMYANVNKEVLNQASIKGTAVHKAIEEYETKGVAIESKELHNYCFLKRYYKFECLDNEIPVILFNKGKPVACGRLDLVLKQNGAIGLGDIKRTATLNKEYVTLQLNLYRLAYQQCYEKEITFLKALHLREDKRKYIDIKIKEKETLNFINESLKVMNNGN